MIKFDQVYWAFPGSTKKKQIRLASREAMNDREIEAQQAGQGNQ